ncbi:MAG: hypothetical protein NC483_07850 [Ruminococcus sp.]|nr:hypothetical protein [Ruminococcus sp.]
MANIKTMELIDGIRHDALILMNSRGDLTYPEAYDLARQNLIGDNAITDFQFKPLSISLELPNEKKDINVTGNSELRGVTYMDDSIREIENIIDVTNYSQAQLKQYVIAHKMGVDISKFASELFSPEQVKFLSVMLASGRNIDKYLDDYNFDPATAFGDMTERENSKTLIYDTNH